MIKLRPILILAFFFLNWEPIFGASGLFPKTPPGTNIYVVNCRNDGKEARRTAFALQGLINQSSAEVYLISNGEGQRSLLLAKEPVQSLTSPQVENAGLETLFQKYQGHVKTMFLYTPEKDWTWYLALMASAQQDGIPVTEPIENELVSKFGWKGKIEDFRNKWANRIEAYDWALTNLMPACSRRVVFELEMNKPLCDYVVASKGFDFWLNPENSDERMETEKIYGTSGYGLGTSLMGYHFDRANLIANPYGIGYVVSENYANASFWASFPDKTYLQSPGKAIKAEPGKIYVSMAWSDGDNLAFDQNSLFDFWHDDRARGTIPVATYMSPTLQELNPPLLDWYYSKMTINDELMCGPTGVQFIYVDDFNDHLFPAWCKLTREWCHDAGFHDVRVWLAQDKSPKYLTYMKTCGFDGVLDVAGGAIRYGYPPRLATREVRSEEDFFDQLVKMEPNPQQPVFFSFTLIVPGFYKQYNGYSAIKRQIDRVEAAYPSRYVFLLPKDEMATIRAYYNDY
jgi:GxGYxY sequence motif in domain of unknown function N-terminal/GxGYxYP putative glycoside hydrolase C-terminal domain